MSNTIRIKRRASGATGAPSSLENAELAYNEVDDTLYYGKGTGGAGGTATIVEAIGGKGAYVGLAGTQTITGNKTFSGTIALGSSASATTQTAGDNSTKVATTGYVDAAVVSATYNFTLAGDSGTSQTVDDAETVTISGGTGLSSVASGTNTITLNLDNTTVVAGAYGSATQIPTFTVDAQGRLTTAGFEAISTSLTVGADSGTADSVALASDTLTFSGGEGIDTVVTNNTITISGEDASTSNKGIASFNSDSFSASSGAISIKSGGVSNAQLVNSSLTIGTTTTSLGGTSLSLAGIQQIDIDNIRIDGNTISSTDVNGGISLDPNGTGHVSVNNARIENLANPVNPQDAATRAYVDGVTQGLHIHATAKAATGDTLAVITGGTVTYDNGTDGVNATLTLGTALTILDNYSLQNGDRILIKNQATAAHNGIYTWATGGTVLTRASDFDTPVEIAGGDFVFVDQGDTYGNTGWVTSSEVNTVGTDPVTFIQFSGAGTFTAGNGLVLDGTAFDINLATNSGLLITSDELQVNSTIAGNGLTFTSGVLAVVGTSDRVSVSADAIDIASTYIGQASITTLGTIVSGTWNGTTIAIANGGTGSTNAADARTALGLAIGTNVQAYDAELAAIAGLTSAADRLPYFTGSGSAALATFTTFGRSLIADVDAAGGRTTLGLGTISTQNSNNVSITGGSVSSISLDLVTIDGGTF